MRAIVPFIVIATACVLGANPVRACEKSPEQAAADERAVEALRQKLAGLESDRDPDARQRQEIADTRLRLVTMMAWRDRACGPETPPSSPDASADALFAEAQRLEQDGKVREAIRVYRRSVARGLAKSAYRLGELYRDGVEGRYPRDAAESQRWFAIAKKMGYTKNAGGR